MINKQDSTCDRCGRLFDSQNDMKQEHAAHFDVFLEFFHRIKYYLERIFSRRSNMIIVFGIIFTIAVAIAGGDYWIRSNISTAFAFETAPVIDSIQCNISEQFLFHIHAHLDIFVDGQLMYIPPQIGIIPDKCIYWLYTHDGTGVIHIESPTKRDFTLGQFFDIWSKKVNNPSSFTSIFGGKNTPTVYINGNKVTGVPNYRDIKLHAHDEIVLAYGTPPTVIPSKYAFPEGL